MFLQDIGDGFGFRPGTFDGAIRYINKQYLYIYISYIIKKEFKY